MTPVITPIPAAAAAPLAVMHAASFPDDPWDAAALERVLRLSGAFGYLAWRGDAPAGFVLARDLGDEIEVLSLGVLPCARRRGIGGALLGAVVAHAAERRIASIVLEVAADNEAARRLYARSGFLGVGRRPRYYRRGAADIDGLIMRRKITDAATLP